MHLFNHRAALIATLTLMGAGLAQADSVLVGKLPRADARPLETLPGLDTELGELRTPDGARLRTFVTRPHGRAGRLPAGLFVQWLSCDSIELSAKGGDGWSQMLRGVLTQSNMVWQRTDKSGVGDSQGVACSKLDYQTELAHHRAALAQLRARSDVDPQRIVVFGASLGATYAPLIAADQDVAGVIVWGGGATTWFERMLRFERNALELGDGDPAYLGVEMTARANFFARYLLQGESPRVIAQSDPSLGAVWARIVGTSGDTHYGRPLAFHQQAQRQNWARAWARVSAPVLVLYGEYDWFESRDAAGLIADVVNRKHPGNATFIVLPKLDHHFSQYANRRDARAERGGTPMAAPAVDAILSWLRKTVDAAP